MTLDMKSPLPRSLRTACMPRIPVPLAPPPPKKTTGKKEKKPTCLCGVAIAQVNRCSRFLSLPHLYPLLRFLPPFAFTPPLSSHAAPAGRRSPCRASWLRTVSSQSLAPPPPALSPTHLSPGPSQFQQPAHERLKRS